MLYADFYSSKSLNWSSIGLLDCFC